MPGNITLIFFLLSYIAGGYDVAVHAIPGLLKGKVWLLNTWTSDCPGCRREHPYLLELARQNIVSGVA